MKFTINETRLRTIVFKFMTHKLEPYHFIDEGNRLLVMGSEDGEHITDMLRIYKYSGDCWIRRGLLDDIVNFFGLKEADAKMYVMEWVEAVVGVEVVDVASYLN